MGICTPRKHTYTGSPQRAGPVVRVHMHSVTIQNCGFGMHMMNGVIRFGVRLTLGWGEAHFGLKGGSLWFVGKLTLA